MGAALLVLLLAQAGLGIANVLLRLPLVLAAAHNAGAALLLAALVVLNFAVFRRASKLMSSSLASQPLASRASQFYQLTKPRVVSLIVFTAVIGMFLATPGMVPLQALVAGTLGIALVAGAAAAVNCLVEQKIDALMTRTSAPAAAARAGDLAADAGFCRRRRRRRGCSCCTSGSTR